MQYIYECYLNNSLGGGLTYQANTVLYPPGTPLEDQTQEPSISFTGSITRPYPYTWLATPNVWPSLVDGATTNALDRPRRYTTVPEFYDRDINIAVVPNTEVSGYTHVKVRLFFGRVTLKVFWNNGTPLKGRWISGGGASILGLDAPFPGDPAIGTLFGGLGNTGGLLWRYGADYRNGSASFGLTDDSGLIEYIYCAGVSVGMGRGEDSVVLSDSGYDWTLNYPGRGGVDGEYFYLQNLFLFTNDKETHVLESGLGFSNPFFGDEKHYFRQYDTGTTTSFHNWGIDYTTAWDSNGLLTIPIPDPLEYRYKQYGQFHLIDTDGSVIHDATVEFGDSFEWHGGMDTPIESTPKGALVLHDDSLDELVSYLPVSEPGIYKLSETLDSSTVPEITSVSQLSNFPALQAPGDLSPIRYKVAYTNRTATKLTGITYQDSPNNYTHTSHAYSVNDLDAGEVLTLPYPFKITIKDGRIVRGWIYIHEDCTNELEIEFKAPNGTLILDIDKLGNRWIARPSDDNQSVTIYRWLGAEGQWKKLNTVVVGSGGWITNYQNEDKNQVWVVYNITPGLINLASNNGFGEGDWQVTVVGEGDFPFINFDKRRDILYLSYVNAGKVCLRHSTDKGQTWLKWANGNVEKQIMDGVTGPYTFDWLHDDHSTMIMPYVEDGEIKLMSSIDFGETWT
jgi:hypothetical protein